jgi:hypothetical protein
MADALVQDQLREFLESSDVELDVNKRVPFSAVCEAFNSFCRLRNFPPQPLFRRDVGRFLVKLTDGSVQLRGEKEKFEWPVDSGSTAVDYWVVGMDILYEDEDEESEAEETSDEGSD